MSIDRAIADALDRGLLRVDLSTGHVFSPRSNTPLRPLGAKTSKGYLRTVFNLDGRAVSIMLHRVVCIAAFGPPPTSVTQVNHRNGIKTDNHPSNIEWASGRANMDHAKRAGLLRPVRHGDHYNARLSAESVADIRTRRATGESARDLARRFGISESHVRRIVAGARWTDAVQDRVNG